MKGKSVSEKTAKRNRQKAREDARPTSHQPTALFGPDGVTRLKATPEPEPNIPVSETELFGGKLSAVVTGLFWSAVGGARSMGFDEGFIRGAFEEALAHAKPINEEAVRASIVQSKIARQKKEEEDEKTDAE